MRINYKQFRKWIEALDSGKFKQTKYSLQDSDGYCCLGVGCRVVIPKDKLEFKYKDVIKGGLPSAQTFAPNWFKQISNDFSEKTSRTLQGMNDSYDFTFPEIATMLELVYIHKALK